MKRKPIDQQVVVIVGAASGIGRETALAFARRGAHLVVADIDGEGLPSLVTEIWRQGGTCVPEAADVADLAQVQMIADTAFARYGRIDTWVQVTGVAQYATFMDTTVDEFRRVIEVNLMGTVHGVRAALPHLIESRGGLICVCSVEARRTLPYHGSYGASKHAIDGFLEALRLELRHEGLPVSVTEILPSTIDTPFFSKARTKLGVEPRGMPPYYPASSVARAILHAAEHPRREIVVGAAGKTLLAVQKLSPTLMDAVLLRVGFTAQRSAIPKSPEAPNDLFGPAGRDNRVEGGFGGPSFTHSLRTWLDLHPAMTSLVGIGTAIGVGAAIGAFQPGRLSSPDLAISTRDALPRRSDAPRPAS